MLLSNPQRVLVLALIFGIIIIVFLDDIRWSIHARIQKHLDQYPFISPKAAQVGTANATFLMLARNSEIEDVLHTLRQIETSFNHRFHYPYVFLNDVEFTPEFIARTTSAISSSASYGVVPTEHWNHPPEIDEERLQRGMKELADKGVDYGGSLPYRNMCRFNSGFFYRHELLQNYRYYWRIEPEVDFFCQIHDDPFQFMQDNNKIYGFTITLYEFEATIPTLWQATKEFTQLYPELLAESNALDFLSDDKGATYNLCHFWSNFEIADMNFWRSDTYRKFFDFLDAKGGFYYERWGDAPVHSIAAALFAPKEQLHFFNEIGYRHGTLQHCPQGEVFTKGQCQCSRRRNFDYDGYSCKPRYDRLFEQH